MARPSDCNIEFSAGDECQVNVSDCRMELDDIESRLADHREVSDAEFVARERETSYQQERKETAIRGSPAQANPLFFVPTGAGDHSYASLLGEHLRTEWPVYILPSHDQMKEPIQTIEAMAVRMAAMIKSIQPRGPYRLIGYLSGGILAYEIAYHFLTIDEPVSFVGLIDTFIQQDSPRTSYVFDYIRSKISSCSNTTDEFMRYVNGAHQDDAFNACLSYALRHGLCSPIQHSNYYQLYHFERAAEQYQPLPSPLTLHLYSFICSDKQVCGEPIVFGWENVLQPSALRFIPVPVDGGQGVRSYENRALLTEKISKSISTGSKEALTVDSADPLHVISYGNHPDETVIFVPGAGASITSFLEMAEALGSSWSTYGLQPRGVDMDLPPHGSVEAAAAFYLKAIEPLSSKRLHLIGHSYGGLVALEMANRLSHRGTKPASVTLIDTLPPEIDYSDVCDVTDVEIMREFTQSLELFYETELGLEDEATSSGKFDIYLDVLVNSLKRKQLFPVGLSSLAMKGPMVSFARAFRSMRAPKCYFGSINVVIARGSRGELEAKAHGQMVLENWQRHASGVTLQLQEGSHFSILRSPHVEQLVGWWQSTVARRASTSRQR